MAKEYIIGEKSQFVPIADTIRAKTNTTDPLPLHDAVGALIDGYGKGEISADVIEFSQMNPVVKSYMENVAYTDDYSASYVASYANWSTDYRKDQPTPDILLLLTKRGKLPYLTEKTRQMLIILPLASK